MSGVEIKAEVDTILIENVLQSLVHLGQNTYALLDEIGGELVSSTQDRFDRGQAPNGTFWEVSARAELKGGKTLKESNLLAEGITHEPTSDYVDVGSDKVYAAIHQFGGETGRNKATKLPERPYLGINEQDQKMIEDTAYTFIEQAAGI